VTAVAEQQPARATRPAGSTRPAHTTGTTGTDQTRCAAAATAHTRIHPGHAVTAIAVQKAAGTTGLPRRGRVRAITNQRATQQRHRRPIHRI
jgi:hypothetical protein